MSASSVLRIAVIAHLRHPIAPPFMGGMEAHCHGLAQALVARGHDVTLFASGDSDRSLPVAAVTPVHYESVLPFDRHHGTPALSDFLDGAFRRAWSMIGAGGFDVIHNNAMHPALHDWALRDRRSMVTSLHVPPFEALERAIARTSAPWLRQTCTSDAHLRSWSRQPPATMSVVHNGIDVDRWPFRVTGNGRAVWCGRITPNKGTHVALAAARAAGIGLDIIGPIDTPAYFDAQVAPLLDQDRVYLGHLSGAALAQAIGSASVLLATPMWDEPFGLIAVEAMACGVPVAALDRGALSEVVGDCGALATDESALPHAIIAALNVSRTACRSRVERFFSVTQMVEGYERAYAAAAAGSSAASARALLA